MHGLIGQSILCPVMLGRDEYLDALRQIYERTVSGEGHTVLVTGEAGIGKTRLVREFYAPIQPAPVVMQASCFEADQSLPYLPIADMLRRYFRSLPAADVKPSFTPLTMNLIQLLPEFALEFPDFRVADDTTHAKRQLHQSIIQWVVDVAAAQPVIMVFEDLHWSDDATLDFVLALARQVKLHRILLLMTYRDDEVRPPLASLFAQLSRERLEVELHLPRLSAEMVASMLRILFTEAFAARSKLVNVIYELSEGNPFFVEEVVKSLVSGQDIYLDAGEWKFKPLYELHTPRTIQVNLSQRLSRLSPDARAVLSLAAVVGKQFDFELLHILSGQTENALLLILRELRDAQFVQEVNADQYTFRHALTQQAVYRELFMRERRTLHLRVGEALEQLFRTEPRRSGEIAYHFHRAQDWARVRTYSLQAADWALKLHSPSASVEHYSLAIEATEQMGQVPDAALLRSRGQLYERIGNFDAARADYGRIIETAREQGNEPVEWQGWLDLGWLWTERDFALAGDYFARALAIVGHMQPTPLVAQTLNRVGNWHLHADQLDQGLHYHRQALAISQELNDLKSQAESLDLLGLTSFYLGHIDRGTEYYEQATQLFRQLGDWMGLSSSLSVKSMRGASYNLDTFVGSPVAFDVVVQEGNEAVDAARKIGWRAGEASALIYCGFGRGSLGDFAGALETTHLGLAIATEIEHVQWQGAAHLVLGAIYRDMLAFDTARKHHEAVYAIVHQLNAPFLYKMVTGHLASTYVASNLVDLAAQILQNSAVPDLPTISIGQRLVWCAQAELLLAQRHADSALDVLQRMTEGAVGVPRLEFLIGTALWQLGQRHKALIHLDTAQEVARTHGLKPLRWRIELVRGKCLQELGRHDQADEAFASAVQVVDTLSTGITDVDLRDHFLLQARARIEQFYRPSPRRMTKKAFDGLTSREREVARYIAQGKSNRLIAEALVLSERTVAKHVENIFNKLGCDSRAQIAAWAVERGLHTHGTGQS